MKTLFEALISFYWFKSSAAHLEAIISFKLAILSLQEAGDVRFVHKSKMVKQITFQAILMAHSYHNYSSIIVLEV